jgi:hypothetical protein
MTFEFMKLGVTWSDLLLGALDYSPQTDFDQYARQMGRIRALPGAVGVLAAVQLQQALKHDPGFFPANLCPDDMCQAPDALTSGSGELTAPVPLWRLVATTVASDTAGSTPNPNRNPKVATDVAGTKTAVQVREELYMEYLTLLDGILAPHLQAMPPPPPSHVEWAVVKASELYGGTPAAHATTLAAARAGGASAGRNVGGAGGSVGEGGGGGAGLGVGMGALLAELRKQDRFEKGLQAILRTRDKTLQEGACPGRPP